ncbi:hypothetical protein CJEDD_03110 [Corynebacterium jeddahense]|uniref:Uncharacterized protein n=1 Tax=Corynebacterium jeddahense TaxID=1414719 RepID=A0ABY7UHJ9_9CORY|nr:hypothetical protein [Corynebacterium jeddahense]WCZ38242.1 hypothetical protein CJEDD_03110 [Corynebacterium jeddahense]
MGLLQSIRGSEHSLVTHERIDALAQEVCPGFTGEFADFQTGGVDALTVSERHSFSTSELDEPLRLQRPHTPAVHYVVVNGFDSVPVACTPGRCLSSIHVVVQQDDVVVDAPRLAVGVGCHHIRRARCQALRKFHAHGVGFLYVCGIVFIEFIARPRLHYGDGPIAAIAVAIHDLIAGVDELNPSPATVTVVYHFATAGDGQGCCADPASFRVRSRTVNGVNDR